MMIYYKCIEIDNLETIQKKTLNYLIKNDWCHRKGLYNLQWQEFVTECPEVCTTFDRYGIKPIFASVHVTLSQEDAKVHIDYISDNKPYTRINIPILNCAGTKTEFYHYSPEMFQSWIQNNGLAFFRIKDDQNPIKVDEVEIVKPTVLRVQEPHRVNIGMSPVPRITLSLSTDKDPIFLLDN